ARSWSGCGAARAPAAADIVIDQIVLGNAGVLTAEATAAGRLVVGHLLPAVRERLTAFDAMGQPPPVVEADPDTLEEVLREILADRPAHQAVAAQGPGWARRNHDGTHAADVLRPWLSPPKKIEVSYAHPASS